MLLRENWWRFINWRDDLIAVITQEADNGAVSTLTWINRDALARALTLGNTHFFSRSRSAAWSKGERSGNTQFLQRVSTDCDYDAILMLVNTWVGSCHTNRTSCFYSNIRSDYHTVLRHVDRIVQSKGSSASYTLHSLLTGSERMVKKASEEITEMVLSLNRPERILIIKEVSDLHYHLLILLLSLGVNPKVVTDELKSRTSLSGACEKSNRITSV